MSILYPSSKILPSMTKPAMIGDALSVDVVMSRETKFESEVTENPVEDGFPVADHVNRKPMTLTMDVVFTPTPVTWASNGTSGRMNAVVNAIMDIYKKAEPITITLSDAIYKDMVMTSAPLPRSIENGYCYRMQLSFVHVRVVSQRVEEVPPEYADNDAAGKAGATDKDAGAAAQEDIGTGLTTVDNTTTINTIDTSNIDLSNAGTISTGKEITANMAAMSIASSLVSAVWG